MAQDVLAKYDDGVTLCARQLEEILLLVEES